VATDPRASPALPRATGARRSNDASWGSQRPPRRLLTGLILARTIPRRLEKLYRKTDEREVDLDRRSLVIFSDHHKGRRDPADDFWICERAYNAALGYYLERGHELFVLGDAEELWENDPEPVLEKYRTTLELEAEFHAHGRYTRFFGNHDLEWRRPDHVAKWLQPLFDDVARGLVPPAEPRPLEVLEAAKLVLKRGGRKEGLLFLFHGHQGTPLSDYLAWASEPLVRHGWRRIQRRRGLPSTSPARNYNLREEHERAAAEWAKRPRPPREEFQPIAIAGHTHRPVFADRTQEQPSDDQIKAKDNELREARLAHQSTDVLRARLEYLKASVAYYEDPEPVVPPAYFNTGCCSFGDGDVTGIEITAEEIKLVRWTKEGQCVADSRRRPLSEVLSEVGQSRSPARAGRLSRWRAALRRLLS